MPSNNAGPSRSDLLEQVTTVTSPTGSAASVSSVVSALPQISSSDVTEQLASLAAQISSLTSSEQSQISALQENTQAVTQNTSSKGSSGASVASTVEGAASSFFGGGFSSLSPLLGGILSLFGGSGSQTLATPAPFMLPQPIQSEAGLTASTPGQVVPVSYSQTGQPRAEASSGAPQVTIQVSAMDSQSFLDRSDDIAMAVRRAILNSSSLNDVIAEL